MASTRILFMGKLRDVAGVGERIVDLPASINSVGPLIEFLTQGNAPLKEALSAPEIRVAIDETIVVHDEAIIEPNEIAFMPAFSGG
ncbi:MAG: hypothetical protein DHS20C05_09070 [Hyphococcus sp.]|nr:MAG: hypothetical protein DHS20C05_09070 [Marinicaulis sp.]